MKKYILVGLLVIMSSPVIAAPIDDAIANAIQARQALAEIGSARHRQSFLSPSEGKEPISQPSSTAWNQAYLRLRTINDQFFCSGIPRTCSRDFRPDSAAANLSSHQANALQNADDLIEALKKLKGDPK